MRCSSGFKRLPENGLAFENPYDHSTTLERADSQNRRIGHPGNCTPEMVSTPCAPAEPFRKLRLRSGI
eukprot:2287398-Prymnesium_polylepis.1